MEPELNAIERIRDQLVKIERKIISPYEGFKNVRWIADLYMVWAEATGAAPAASESKFLGPEAALAGSKMVMFDEKGNWQDNRGDQCQKQKL